LLVRSALVAVLSLSLLGLGVGVPIARADIPPVVPATVTARVEGLPAWAGPPGTALDLAARADDAPGLSRAVATPIPFSMVGFGVPEDVRVLDFRTSPDGATWTDWQPTEIEGPGDAVEPGTAEAAGATVSHMTEAVWVGAATHVQVRVDGGDPAEVIVHLIDSDGLSRTLAQRTLDAVAVAWRGGTTPSAARADVDAPVIVSREQWGADESLRRGSPSYATNAKAVIVHHTAGSNDYTKAQSAAVVRGIYAYHTKSNGWADIGYNILIDRYGTVYEGRKGGLERAVVGAHASDYNTGTVGVSVMGNFDTGAVPAVALATLADVLAWKMEVHHIDPSATTTIGSDSAAKTGSTIRGHRDVGSTACPGRNLYPELGRLRSTVADRIGDMLVQPEASPRLVRLGDGGAAPEPVRLAVDLVPAGPWALTITDRDGTTVHSDAGTGAQAVSMWRTPAVTGLYTWTFASPGRRAATGEIAVARDVLDRIGAESSAAAAAVDISRRTFADRGSAGHAVLARADVFADAMSGGPLAGSAGPLLFTGSDALDPLVDAELERVLPEGRTVYVLGGTGAVDDEVLVALEDRWDVRRVSGPERTATAAAVAELVRARSGAKTVMVARAGPDDAAPWADALAGGAYGAKAGVPVLLTYPTTLTQATRSALRGVERTYVLGGESAVSDAVMAQMPNPQRIAGPDRTGTAVAIAEQLWGRTSGSSKDVVIIGGGFQTTAWTLALAASPLAARVDAPLLLTSGTALSPPTRTHLQSRGYKGDRTASGFVLGGTGAIEDRVLVELSALLQ
jgi:putative cell wall-binding protein/endonuclease V-like protein UPF0215 family